MRDENPVNTTKGELANIVRLAVRSELYAAGLRTDGKDHIDEAREDFAFLRKARKAYEKAAGKIGSGIILSIIGALGVLIALGLKVFVKT